MLLVSSQRPTRQPTRLNYLRRRTVAGAAAAGVLVALVGAVRGDPPSRLEAQAVSLSSAQQAQLPWRAVVTDGAAGVLDGRGLPSATAQSAALERYRAIGLPIYCAGGRGHYAALTFDDGPSSYSPQVLDMLRRAGAEATFFVIGGQIPGATGIVRRQARAGTVGDHTWDHVNLTRMSAGDVASELDRTRRAIERTAHQPVTLVRAPYGARDAVLDARIRQLGFVHVLWDVDTRDSVGAGTTGIVQNAESGLAPGAIVLMHETSDRSLAALPQVLVAARRKHLRLVTAPQLLALDPPPDALVRAGGVGCEDREHYRREEDAGGMRLSANGGATR
ncbi:MAG TPA: polysaccharide deacetylase family protein [Solirubrobacteraceae bacterium]|nr:polysaccharide deacetylase family protein [Solirubrobacteraceae bacterium]